MIIGIGADIVDIRRIKKMLDRHGEAFIKRTLTEDEAQYTLNFKQANAQAQAFARRFAAKEAAAKALGTGFGHEKIQMREISVQKNEYGAPHLLFSGAAENHLKILTPAGKKIKTHLSLSDDPPYAQAFVIIEAI